MIRVQTQWFTCVGRALCAVGIHRWWDPDWLYADGEECERCGVLR